MGGGGASITTFMKLRIVSVVWPDIIVMGGREVGREGAMHSF